MNYRSIPRRPSAWAGFLLASLAASVIATPVAAASSAYLVKDLNGSRSGGGQPLHLTVVGGTLFFASRSYNHGVELWKSDGTSAGTVRVKEIAPGSASSAPEFLVDVNGTLFFSAYNAANGRELWKSDGTDSGTVLVTNIRPGATSSDPQQLTAVGSRVFFTADTGQHGRELWVSDGTPAGTTLVKDINPGAGDAFALAGDYPWLCQSAWEPDPELVAQGSRLFFKAKSTLNGTPQLWVTDGTGPGTKLVKDKNGRKIRDAHYMTAVGSRLFMSRGDDADSSLWRTDGTKAGTRKVSEVDPYMLVAVDGTLFFRSRVFDAEWEQMVRQGIWKSDGTAAGTMLVKDVVFPAWMGAFGDRLFFTSSNGVDPAGHNMWLSDGTPEGTNPIATAPDFFREIMPVGDSIYYTADGGGTIYRTDATGPAEVVPAPSHASCHLTGMDGTLFFTEYLPNAANNQNELWAYTP